MRQPRSPRVLSIYLGEHEIGELIRGRAGDLTFRYLKEWLETPDPLPVSLSLPLTEKPHRGPQVLAYFDNLLPDNEDIRERIAAREGAESTRSFDLLAAIGQDCIGALRLLPKGEEPDPTGIPDGRPVSDAEIAQRLRNLRQAPLGRNPDDDREFRISIAGAQDKTAFLANGKGGWIVPHGAVPTSHIFKPPIGRGDDGPDLSDSVENEWLCLLLCRELGLTVNRAEIMQFEDTKALVVERFDRVWRNGILRRLPQEDMCQAFGIPSSRKYEENGGPGIVEILNFLGRSNEPEEDQAAFLRAQIICWLLAAPDAHAKNYSIFLRPGGFRLTPVYDVMTSAPYAATYRAFSPQRVRLAMAVGRNRRYRMAEIAVRHWLQTVEMARLPENLAMETIRDLTERTGPAIENVSRTLPEGFPGPLFETTAEQLRARQRILELAP